MQETIRWGILGPGGIARRFADGLKMLDDAALVAVGSRSRERAEAFAREYGARRAWGSYEELVRDPEVDAVYVATPHTVHAEHSLLALAEGKAVLCEKPFTLNAAQARTVVETARRKRAFCMEAMWTRFLPTMTELRKLLDARVVGEARMLHADFGFRFSGSPSHRLLAPSLGGGSLLDVGVYPISLSHMIFGTPTAVTGLAHFGGTGVDEQAAVALRFRGGALASCTCAVRTATPQAALVLGTEGSIDLGRLWWCGTEITLQLSGETRHMSPPRNGNGYNYEAAEVGRCLREGSTESPILGLDETIRVMETMDELRRQWGLSYPGE
jgi:predicted dehydrogenase